ncbi:MAG: hypothetical protein ACETWG_07995, partial [Candidatus Neomarinimicrobiota bacterium]
PKGRKWHWLGGAAMAGTGFIIYTGTEEDHSERKEWGGILLLIGLLKLEYEMLLTVLQDTSTVKNQDSLTIRPMMKPAQRIPILVSAGSTSWTLHTNSEGRVRLNISDLAIKAAPDKSLTIKFATKQDPTHFAVFTVPPSVVDYYSLQPNE